MCRLFREEPTVSTADLCAQVGHEQCKGVDTPIEGHEDKPVFWHLPESSSNQGGPNWLVDMLGIGMRSGFFLVGHHPETILRS